MIRAAVDELSSFNVENFPWPAHKDVGPSTQNAKERAARFVGPFVNKMREGLTVGGRFDVSLANSPHLVKALLLDPLGRAAHLVKPILEPAQVAQAKEQMIGELTAVDSAENGVRPAEINYLRKMEMRVEPKNPANGYAGIDVFGFGAAAAAGAEGAAGLPTIRDEVESFFAHRSFAVEVEKAATHGGQYTPAPGAWWKWWASHGRASFPRVSLLALKYLYIDMSEAESERVFSTAGVVLDKRRSRMADTVIEMLVMLKRNMRFVNAMLKGSDEAKLWGAVYGDRQPVEMMVDGAPSRYGPLEPEPAADDSGSDYDDDE